MRQVNKPDACAVANTDIKDSNKDHKKAAKSQVVQKESSNPKSQKTCKSQAMIPSQTEKR